MGLLGIALLVACRGDVDPGDPQVTVRLGLSPTPPTVGPTRILVEVSEAGRAVGPGRLTVEGSMAHAGMVPVLDSGRAEGPGRWVVPAFDFSMAGDWVVEVTLELEDGRRAVRRFPVRVTGREGGEEAR